MPISREEFRTYCKDVFPEYAWALVGHVWVVVFCVLAAILGVVTLIIDIPPWVWVVAALSGVFIAQFLAWDSMRKERNQLRRYDITQGTLTQLSEFRDQLIAMQNENVRSESEFGAWRQRYSDVREGIGQFIGTNISPAEAKLYETLGDYAPIAITGKNYVSYQHLDITSRVIRDHRWLDKAVQDYGRKRFRPGFSGEG